jgi:hypothetical protein
MTHRVPLRGLVVLCSLLTAWTAFGHTPAEEMAQAAHNLLATLSPEQRSKATFELTSEERQNWHFIPRARKGLPFKEMTPVQQRLAHALLASGLSQRGYAKAVTIMTLEAILKDLEAGKGPLRDEELYYVSLFGTPGDSHGWAWRVEGHHLALNFTISGGSQVAASPAFYGTNPADVLEGPRKGLRVLGTEEDLGRSLIRSLTEDQRKVALIATNAPKDIITSADRKVKPLPEAGLAFGKMKKEQQALLRSLVEEFVHRFRPELAASDLGKIQKGGWDKLRFAWAGGLEKFQGHYYRVQGPSFLLEYDNVQNNNNHIHTVWRDFENDFGEDILKHHYEDQKH